MEQSWFRTLMESQNTINHDQLKIVEEELQHRLGFPSIKTENAHHVIFTCSNAIKDGCGFMLWFRKQYSTHQSTLYRVLLDLSQHDGSCQLTPSENCHTSEGSLKELNLTLPSQIEQPSEKLYGENQITLLKKQLQFASKGLISKSTDIDHDKNLTTCIRFKCKNYPFGNICPFLHTLQYKCHINGKPYYTHKSINNSHISECIMDDENIQYNVTARKIDGAMNILEDIIQQDPTIKPKIILQSFAEKLGEESEEFLYDGLSQKNIKRSIKKYFDNAVAKVKTKIKFK